MSADLLELNPKHKSILTKLYHECIEVDDYTDDDIKEYFEKPGIEWRGWKKKKGHVK